MIARLLRAVKRVWRWRSARTGRYVSKAYAEEHPAETVRERVRPPT